MKKKLSAQYIAGFFDGEGSIYVPFVKGRLRRPVIQIGQKYPQILYQINKTIGFGHIIKTVTNSHRLCISRKEEVIEFINFILPYIVIKKLQLKIGLEFCRLVGPPAGPQRCFQKRSLNSKNLNRRKELYRKLKELKTRDYK